MSRPPNVSRRGFLAAGLAVTAAPLTGAGCRIHDPAPRAILDTHTHFYDPTRPGGVPWPPAGDAILHRPRLPVDFFREATPLGITSTLVVEASPMESDNDWVLALAATERRLVGLVGHLKPGTDGFSSRLEHALRHPGFRGIRVGTWERPLEPGNPGWMRDVGRVAEAGLAVDVIVQPDELASVARLARALPSLPIVINHCANVRIDGGLPPDGWRRGMADCASASDSVSVKVSGLVEGAGGGGRPVPDDAVFYSPVLRHLDETFGPRRQIFGSNWPVCTRFAPLETVVGIVRQHVGSRSAADQAAFWIRNGRSTYGV